MGWQRARNPEQKAERRKSIVAAGARLLEDAAMSDVSLNAIAREAGLAKSNLYRYFATREEIFLALLTDDIDGWSTRCSEALEALPTDPSPASLAKALVGTMTSHPRLVRLMGQLVSVLERNASAEAIVDFKLGIRVMLERLANALVTKVSWMTQDDAHQIAFFQTSLLQGLWPYHDPPPSLVEACSHPSLQHPLPPLETTLERAVTVLLEGLATEAARRSP